MNDFSKYIDEISKPVEFSPKGDIGPVGDICPIASDSHDFCYDFDEETSSVNDEEDEEDFDATEFKYLTDYEMHEQRKRDDKHYDRLFKKYRNSKKSSTFHDEEIDQFDYVKSYYSANIEAQQKSKNNAIKAATMAGGSIVVGFLLVSIIASMAGGYKSANTDHTYVIQKNAVDSSELQAITASKITDLGNRLREKHQIDNQGVSSRQENQPIITKADPVVIPAPSVVNNYNFDQLNTGLTTLGYSLIACFMAFFSFKGLAGITKSFKLKREIKKSKQLLDDFKSVISKQNNQLEISQLINDQIVINNILIERLNKNNNVVQLIAVNEKMKDTSQFINNNLITNFKEV